LWSTAEGCDTVDGMKRRNVVLLLFGVTLAVAAAACLAPRVGQPPAYHHFADTRDWLGVANFGDVASNLPFAAAGIWGIFLLLSGAEKIRFVDERERVFWVILFLGLLMTAVGSAYYHLAPDNARLVWDRIPMTVVFMPLVGAVIGERVSVNWGLFLLPFLLAIGVGSVLQWRASELQGRGDLRFYAAVQIYALVTLLLASALPARYTRRQDLLVVVGFYILAKLLETGDQVVYSAGHLVSGHTLKHLAAGAAGFWILRMLRLRRAVLNTKT